MDNARRLQLENLILRGQQAKTALSFFIEFEEQQKSRLWEAVQRGDEPKITAISMIARTAGEFRTYLATTAGNGVIAEKELQEDTQNG